MRELMNTIRQSIGIFLGMQLLLVFILEKVGMKLAVKLCRGLRSLI